MIRKAERRQMKIKIALAGAAGSGKTMGALRVAYGLIGDWEKICLIDSENFSGNVYANYCHDGIEIGEYYILPIEPPYTADKYITAISECEQAGIECAIIDSLSHAWAGEGGVLDQKTLLENRKGYNSFTAWKDMTAIQNKLVNAIFGSKMHIICTLRTKPEYLVERNDAGKSAIKKIGTKPIQRDDLDYEFTIFANLDQDHNCMATKDQTGLFDGKVFQACEQMGEQLKEWNATGSDGTDYRIEASEKTAILGNRRKFAAFLQTLHGSKEIITDKVSKFIGSKYKVESSVELSADQWADLTSPETLDQIRRLINNDGTN